MPFWTFRIEQSLSLSTRHGAETPVEKAKSGEWERFCVCVDRD